LNVERVKGNIENNAASFAFEDGAYDILKIVRGMRPPGAVPQSVETDFESGNKYNPRAGDLL